MPLFFVAFNSRLMVDMLQTGVFIRLCTPLLTDSAEKSCTVLWKPDLTASNPHMPADAPWGIKSKQIPSTLSKTSSQSSMHLQIFHTVSIKLTLNILVDHSVRFGMVFDKHQWSGKKQLMVCILPDCNHHTTTCSVIVFTSV